MHCQSQILIQVNRGDSSTLAIATAASFDLVDADSILFTVKRSYFESDNQALIQKSLGAGITVTSSQTLDIELVPADTMDIQDPNLNLVWDVQVQKADGQVLTIAKGQLRVFLDVTQLTQTSIPIFTSNPPLPGNGGSGASGLNHVQDLESDLWIINHNFGYCPTVDAVNSAGIRMYAEVLHFSVNQVRVLFNTPQVGKARLI